MDKELSFGAWLREKRNSLGLTRGELARRVLYSAATIRKIEGEERRPSTDLTKRLASVFGITVEEYPVFENFARGKTAIENSNSGENNHEIIKPQFSKSSIPAMFTSFVGREREVSEIEGYLKNPEIRLITLIGPPGIGKTRLAIEAARRVKRYYEHGVYFVSLSSLHEVSQVPAAMLKSLGFVEPMFVSLLEHLGVTIADHRLLLVLDNCEHLDRDLSPMLSELLQKCPNITILATSREAFNISGEWLYVVPALDVPDDLDHLDMETVQHFPAIKLFAERARANCPEFKLCRENLADVAEICLRLDGLPLAIELVAARARLTSVQGLLERLKTSDELSSTNTKSFLLYDSLYRALQWCYHRLSQTEKFVFAFLSVYSGSFNLESVEYIVNQLLPGVFLPDVLDSLLDKSLLQRTLDVHGSPRFYLLETIRIFAQQCLQEIGWVEKANDLHLEYYVSLAEKGELCLRGPSQVEWADFLDAEFHNFRKALAWGVMSGKVESVLRLFGSLGWAWEIRGHYSEAKFWLSKIQALPELNCHPLFYGRVLNHVGRQCWTQGEFTEALGLLHESLNVLTPLGEEGETNLAETYNWMGLVYNSMEQEKAAASGFVQNGLELYQKHHDRQGVALSTFHLGIIESLGNGCGESLARLEKSLEYFREVGDLFFMARVSAFLGEYFLTCGEINLAYLYFLQRLYIDKKIKFWDGIAEGWRDLGRVFQLREKPSIARKCLLKSLEVCHQHGLHKPDIQNHGISPQKEWQTQSITIGH